MSFERPIIQDDEPSIQNLKIEKSFVKNNAEILKIEKGAIKDRIEEERSHTHNYKIENSDIKIDLNEDDPKSPNEEVVHKILAPSASPIGTIRKIKQRFVRWFMMMKESLKEDKNLMVLDKQQIIKLQNKRLHLVQRFCMFVCLCNFVF